MNANELFWELESDKIDTKAVLARPIAKADRKATLKIAKELRYDEDTLAKINNATTYGEMERILSAARHDLAKWDAVYGIMERNANGNHYGV